MVRIIRIIRIITNPPKSPFSGFPGCVCQVSGTPKFPLSRGKSYSGVPERVGPTGNFLEPLRPRAAERPKCAESVPKLSRTPFWHFGDSLDTFWILRTCETLPLDTPLSRTVSGTLPGTLGPERPCSWSEESQTEFPEFLTSTRAKSGHMSDFQYCTVIFRLRALQSLSPKLIKAFVNRTGALHISKHLLYSVFVPPTLTLKST